MIVHFDRVNAFIWNTQTMKKESGRSCPVKPSICLPVNAPKVKYYFHRCKSFDAASNHKIYQRFLITFRRRGKTRGDSANISLVQ